MAEIKLTPKQQRFVREYLVDLNASAAALRAGYKWPEIGRRLVTKSHVAEAIAEGQRKQAEATEITAARVLRELARIAFADPRKLFDEGGELLPIDRLPDEVAACIASIEIVERKEDGEKHRVRKIRLVDKRGALELLGKHLALFIERMQITDEPEATVTDEPMSPDEWERKYATH